jgi:hypothetical protein
VNPNTIWGERQNNPELVVQDAKVEFGLTDEQCEKMREILMRRGVNKWLYARRLFIQLKHDCKEIVKHGNVVEQKLIQPLYERMQHIANLPRWVEWPARTPKKLGNITRQIVVKGPGMRGWRRHVESREWHHGKRYSLFRDQAVRPEQA